MVPLQDYGFSLSGTGSRYLPPSAFMRKHTHPDFYPLYFGIALVGKDQRTRRKARASKCYDVHGLHLIPADAVHVTVMFHERQPLCGHPDRKRLHFTCKHRADSGKHPAKLKSAGAGEQAAQRQFSILIHPKPPPPPVQRKQSALHPALQIHFQQSQNPDNSG
ncbi:hypothetical protein IMSAGC019_00298 [Lachnospiraceae bacterium]|nr:hypothetical protein IMSAGC019_00298 [Lachnospiraceae bacterium]